MLSLGKSKQERNPSNEVCRYRREPPFGDRFSAPCFWPRSVAHCAQLLDKVTRENPADLPFPKHDLDVGQEIDANASVNRLLLL